MFSDEKVKGFVALLDRAIAIAQERINHRAQRAEDKAPRGALEPIVEGLSEYKEQALSGKLPPSEGRVTLGILRAVADWGEDDKSPLFTLAQDLERYYLKEMK